MNYFNYFSEIEETFIRRRGKHLLLSPLDWAMIESWQERQIPLHIVLRGIEKVFDCYDAKLKKNRTIKSLMYCKEEIEAQYEEWLESQIGKNNAQEVEETKESSIFSDDTIAAHLENVSLQFENAKLSAKNELGETLERVWNRLQELKTGFTDAETLETDLTALEKLIDECLLANTANEEFALLKANTENQLKSYKPQMETEVYQRTFDLMLLKKLHEKHEIPRLSLFYL